MIPVKLTLEGLYSYQKRQTIDFSELTASGLFGIFGATGSGKSSILEAITYALYGDTERLNARDKRSYNMMNLKSDRAYIEFDFYNYENDLYKITRDFKRNSKNFLDVRSPKVVFYRYKKDEWEPLTHNNAEKIIGLSYKNFRQTIIIPQGRFKEFLEQGLTERTQMMKDIFKLHRFDLQDKTSKIRRENQAELKRLEGVLSSYEEIQKETLENKQQLFGQLQKQREKKEKEYSLQEEKYQKLKYLKSDFDQLQKKEGDLASLRQKEATIREKEREWDQYERIYQVFYTLLVDQKAIKNERKENLERKESIAQELRDIRATLNEKEKELENIRPYYNELEHKKTAVQDLKYIAQVMKHSSSLNDCGHRMEEGAKLLQHKQKEQATIEDRIKQQEFAYKKLKNKKANTRVFRAVGNWFTTNRHLLEQQQKPKEKRERKENRMLQIKKELEERGMTSDFEEKIKLKTQNIEVQKERLRQQRENLNVRKKLFGYAHDLKPGEACPLCGSLEHPNVLEEADVSAEREEISKNLASLDQREEVLQKEVNFFRDKKNSLQALDGECKEEQKEIENIREKLKNHREQFIWKDFHPEKEDTFKEKEEEAERIEKEISRKEEELSTSREEESKIRKILNKYEKRLNELREEAKGKQAEMKTYEQNIQRLKIKDYRDWGEAEIEKEAVRLHRKNREVEEQYNTTTNVIQDLRPRLAAKKTQVEGLQDRIDESTSKLQDLEEKIRRAMEKEDVDDIEKVRKILQSGEQWDIKEERRKIDHFKIELKSTKNSVDELRHKLKEISFTEKAYRKEKEKWESVKKALEKLRETIAVQQDTMAKLKKDLEKKKAMQEEQEKIQKRVDNLEVLYKLFIKAGFVNYVSSIYLSQLCAQANVRFRRMTRNQLELQINSHNEFEIIDYLNEGKTRSVKTLSGGQAFQVALSLALALADSVQAHAKAGKKFFFIDEGFGTEDPEALNITFETLVHLNKEQKIVGIISHVDGLKDRIPKALEIKKDPEKGSLLRMV